VTDEELARFALVLSEVERIRAQIAEDDAAARASDDELQLLAAPSVAERPPIPAAA
jgi:uncharacterized small protein (DUF1192 family)